jgi:hypothetical protein
MCRLKILKIYLWITSTYAISVYEYALIVGKNVPTINFNFNAHSKFADNCHNGFLFT